MNDLEKFIVTLADKKDKISGKEISSHYQKSVSRQYISQIIQKLVKDGKLFKIGSTRNAYFISSRKKMGQLQRLVATKIKLKNKNLEEHEVLDKVIEKTLFFESLKENIKSIFNYTFSEMLNNAIEHSKSKNIEVEVFKDNNKLNFVINDFGIGVFRNVMRTRNLKSELEAIQDLLKGKTTTQPQSHTGEGIFFTSRLADVFTLESFGYKLTIDNKIPDIFIGKAERMKRGTKVSFSIDMNSNKHTIEIFKKYQTNKDTMEFGKTEVRIKLYTMGTIHISRSQARRVLSGLEKFKVIVMDFDKVPMIGQGFADEIFRVFKTKHPDINIQPINMNDAVEFIVKRAKSNL